MSAAALAVAIVAPTIARANVNLTYSNLVGKVTVQLEAFETGGTSINETTNTFGAGDSLLASETGLSAGAGLFFNQGLYPDPDVQVVLAPFLPKGYADARFGVSAEVTYYFSVHAGFGAGTPQPTFIPIDISGSFTGGNAQMVTGAAVDVYGGYSQPIAQAGEYDSYAAGENNGYQLTIDALPFQVYEVRIQASGSACVTAVANETCAATPSKYNGTYTSGIDPIVAVDPSVADTGDYVLTMSAGLAPSAPEPSASAMLLLGFGALGLWGARAGSVRLRRRTLFA